ncbi:MAG: ABC transporter permease [Bacteroidota bacterium]
MPAFFRLFARSVFRNKLFASVNILGLTVGFFAAAVIYMHVKEELSYDQFHQKGDRIYRINQTFIWGNDNPNQFSSTGPGVSYAINAAIPEVEQVTRVHTADMTPITFEKDGEQKFFNDEWIFAVDSNFFDFFSFKLKYGDIETALSEARSVVLKSEIAEKFFGDINPVGLIIQMDGGESFRVTGVLEPDLPSSYVDNFDLLVSLSSIERITSANDNWMWTMFETFILLNEQADPAIVKEKLQNLPKEYAVTTLGWMGYTYQQYVDAGKKWDLFMQPLTEVYLRSDKVYNRLSSVGDLKVIFTLTGAAFFLIILSCINFINLSTAQFTARAKDIALRKVLGISKLRIGARFISESIMYCFVALFLALLLLQAAIPYINQSMDAELNLDILSQPLLLVFLFVLLLLIATITGLYPFLFFSAFKPVKTLKGELKTGKKGLLLRNGMLALQYGLSFILLICSFTIFDQLRFFMNKELGFEKENLVAVQNVDWLANPESFVNEISKIEGVSSTALCGGLPMIVTDGDQFTPDEPGAGSFPLNFTLGDENFMKTVGLELIVGRTFDKDFGTDSSAVILNETAAASIGWPIDERILNRKIENWSGQYHVIGVVKDFNFWILHAPIEPFALFHDQGNPKGGQPLSMVAVRLSGTDTEIATAKSRLEEKWIEFAPNKPYESTVLTDHFSESYQSEEKFGDILSFFSFLTIIIASLGLFGIVVFSVEQKLKEIGVRKVLGASIMSLVVLFSRHYIKLLVIAFCIATPIGYFFMEGWLDGFAYRISLNPLSYLFSFAILFVISLIISILHTVRAAMMNPASILKDE